MSDAFWEARPPQVGRAASNEAETNSTSCHAQHMHRWNLANHHMQEAVRNLMVERGIIRAIYGRAELLEVVHDEVEQVLPPDDSIVICHVHEPALQLLSVRKEVVREVDVRNLRERSLLSVEGGDWADQTSCWGSPEASTSERSTGQKGCSARMQQETAGL